MTKLTLYSIPLLALVFGCQVQNRVVSGDGAIVPESRDVSTFSGVSISGALRAEISEGPPSVRLELDRNIIDLVDTHLEGSVLVIRPNENGLDLVPSALARIVITTPHLDSVDTSGIAAVDAQSTGEPVKISASGGSHVALAGMAPHVSVLASGTAVVDCAADATAADIDSSGKSQVGAFASTSVGASASGESRVTIRGNPADRHVETSGTASVVFSE